MPKPPPPSTPLATPPSTPPSTPAPTSPLLAVADALAQAVDALDFSLPVTHVYDPLVYARAPYAQYVERYGRGPREVILLGMNPGPYGMAQTGVPFGEVGFVRDWLGIDAVVGHPPHEHDKRPVHGFACTRSEVSGARLWGWAQHTCGEPGRFFARFFVANYCPLVFMEASGKNRTPDKLPAAEREPLFAACDRALVGLVAALRPRFVIGVGAFAEARAKVALTGHSDVTIGRIAHPSPASPLANRGWEAVATADLAALGLAL